MPYLPLHPMLVHFPLALTFTAAFCLFAAQLSSRDTLRQSLSVVGTWNLILGAVAIEITLATGVGAAYHLHLVDGAQYSTSRHMLWAVCTSQCLAFLALWRGLGGRARVPPGWLFLTLLSVVCMALIVTGYYGGENVYHYRLGLEPH